jgi:2-oxoisovalerate dehydrogenase E2 component (dihydrolipoyl transacylase)
VKQFRLPDPGEGLVEAEIVTWRVAVGDVVEINDIVVEIETSKSLVELPTPYAGTVSALLAAEGDMVEVGTPIISIDDGVESTDPPLPEPAAGHPEPAPPRPEPVEGQPSDTAPQDALPSTPSDEGDAIEAGKIGGAAPGGRVAVLVGYGPRTTEAKRRPRKAPAEPLDVEAHEQVADTFSTSAPVSFRGDERRPLSPSDAAPVGAPLPGPGAPPSEPPPRRGAILAKPPVRKLAKDLGLDLSSVSGTGPGGVITRDDVQQAAKQSGPAPVGAALRHAAPDEVTADAGTTVPVGTNPPASPPAPRTATRVSAPAASRVHPGDDTRIPMKGVRKATAEAMVSSAFTAPHVTEWLTCDVTAAMELLERIKARRDFAGVRVSPLLLVAKAACLALARTPDLNSTFDAEAAEIVLKGTVNLGIAAATPRGLLVPNIKDAQTLSLLELAEAINSLVAVAKEGRTQPADTAAGTFTITNVGVFGIDAGTPILNPGESGILCLGAITRRPWVVGSGADERIEPRWVTTLALSFDHRVVDGEQGSTFLAHVAAILSDPGLALLF